MVEEVERVKRGVQRVFRKIESRVEWTGWRMRDGSIVTYPSGFTSLVLS